jgi:RNA polymerase sigma-70 factor, ECF subfamily
MPIDSGSDRDRDRALVAQLKGRNPHAMEDLYDRYGKLVYSIILRSVGDSGTAEDLTQETFLRVWNRIHTFDEGRGRLEAWLVTVARNRAFDHLRTNRASTASLAGTSELDYVGLSSLVDESDRISRKRSVSEALKNLNSEQREVIELTHFEGMTQTEIAAKLQKPLGTVKSLVRSALKTLRTSMIGEVQ